VKGGFTNKGFEMIRDIARYSEMIIRFLAARQLKLDFAKNTFTGLILAPCYTDIKLI